MELSPYVPRVSGKTYTPRVPDDYNPFRRAGDDNNQALQPSPGGGGGGITLEPFDIIGAPEGGFTLYLPFVRKSNKENVGSLSVSITIADFEIAAGSWLVAKMVGPIATFISAPAITIEVATGNWSGYPNSHLTDETTPYNWTESRIPLWQFLTEENKTDSSVLLLTVGDVRTYGQKLIGSSPQLIYTLALATGDRLRTVPDLI